MRGLTFGVVRVHVTLRKGFLEGIGGGEECRVPSEGGYCHEAVREPRSLPGSDEIGRAHV